MLLTCQVPAGRGPNSFRLCTSQTCFLVGGYRGAIVSSKLLRFARGFAMQRRLGLLRWYPESGISAVFLEENARCQCLSCTFVDLPGDP